FVIIFTKRRMQYSARGKMGAAIAWRLPFPDQIICGHTPRARGQIWILPGSPESRGFHGEHVARRAGFTADRAIDLGAIRSPGQPHPSRTSTWRRCAAPFVADLANASGNIRHGWGRRLPPVRSDSGAAGSDPRLGTAHDGR